MKTTKTNAIRMLDRLGIPYRIQVYDTADGQTDGLAVAQKTGRDAQMVYKTLVARGASGTVCVFCLPVNAELDLKQGARAAGEKSVRLLPLAELTDVTGYMRGGVSPIGMKKRYPTFVDAAAAALTTMLVSGGRVGTQIELAPADLMKAADASWLETADRGG